MPHWNHNFLFIDDRTKTYSTEAAIYYLEKPTARAITVFSANRGLRQRITEEMSRAGIEVAVSDPEITLTERPGTVAYVVRKKES